MSSRRGLRRPPVAHADETGLPLGGKPHWLHVLCTAMLTWIGCQPKRGKKAFDAFGPLAAFVGILAHDGWKPYRELDCPLAFQGNPPQPRFA